MTGSSELMRRLSLRYYAAAMAADATWDEAQALGARIVSGDAAAWDDLWVALEPHLETWIASPSFLGRVSTDEDRRRDVLVLCWEKLQDGEFSKLRAFFASGDRRGAGGATAKHPFRAWLRRVVKNLGIDYMRTLPEHIRHRKPRPTTIAESRSGAQGRGASEPKHWHSIVSLHTGAGAGARPHVTVEQTARQMLDYLDESIPARQRRAVELHEAGASMAEIAADLKLSSQAAAERAVARAQDRMLYRAAVELWTQQIDDATIADLLGLDGPRHAYRIVNAAKEHLKRTFRG